VAMSESVCRDKATLLWWMLRVVREIITSLPYDSHERATALWLIDVAALLYPTLQTSIAARRHLRTVPLHNIRFVPRNDAA